jgi:hypothetical protein
VTLELVCFAKTPQLGKIVAYDVLAHAGKVASFVENKEIVVLEAPTHKAKYVKPSCTHSTVQIGPKYFGGDEALTVRAERFKTCDETSPTIRAQIAKTGTYLLTDAYKLATSLCHRAKEWEPQRRHAGMPAEWPGTITETGQGSSSRSRGSMRKSFAIWRSMSGSN